MPRLRKELVERVELFSDRALDVSLALPRRVCPGFVRDQLGRSCTSVGSNTCEADEAISAREFIHRLGIALRELGETRYWFRTAVRRGWIKQQRMTALQAEADEIARILATIVIKTSKSLGINLDNTGPADERH